MAMSPREYVEALEELGFNPASQRTANLLGVNLRQCQRYTSGDADVPGPVEILIRMYRMHGTNEKRVTVRSGRQKAEAVMVDKTGIWDIDFPWGTERLQAVCKTNAQLEKAVRARFQKRKEQMRKDAA